MVNIYVYVVLSLPHAIDLAMLTLVHSCKSITPDHSATNARPTSRSRLGVDAWQASRL